MTSDRIHKVTGECESLVREVYALSAAKVLDINELLHEEMIRQKETTELKLSSVEVKLTRTTVTLQHDAEFHVLRAYYHASPSLWSILTAIFKFIATVISYIQTADQIIYVITGEHIDYWLGKISSDLEDVWNNLMNKISEFSGALGWGVDGVHHLLNVIHSSVVLGCGVAGRDLASVNLGKIEAVRNITNKFSYELSLWQKNPGQQIAKYADMYAKMHFDTASFWSKERDWKIKTLVEKAEDFAKGLGDITGELLAIRERMPQIVAKNIPQAIWDSLERADTMINDRLLPRLDKLQERIDSIDKLLDEYRTRTAELAERMARPGDLLSEIKSLPDYVRKDQLSKIDEITSLRLGELNEEEYRAMEAGLKESARIREALESPPPPLPFMELELPGRSPGITAEPRETWFVGDY